MALMDMGATDNFISVGEVEKLRLKVKNSERWAKAVNSKARPIAGS